MIKIGGKKQSDQGYVTLRQLNLLQHAVADWPRREAPLLVINCGDGRFLHMLWKSGFDVIATEPDKDLRTQAMARQIPGLEVRAAPADDVPFEDDSFDWVVAALRVKESRSIKSAAEEAVRVARRGVLVVFWNRYSLAALCSGKRGAGADYFKYAVSWRSVWNALESLHSGNLTGMATLCGPVSTWQANCCLSFLNTFVSLAPFGAWCGIRLNLSPLQTGTPLALRLSGQETGPAAVMEYSNKFSQPNSSR